MYKLIITLNCAILITSNPLQGFQSCPLTTYQSNYVTQTEPKIPLSNFNPYQQQIRVQNQLAPSYQTIPYQYNDQINQYFDKSLANPNHNLFANSIISIYDQNGVEIKRYIANPTPSLPNVLNNYIIVPAELINKSSINKIDKKKSNWKKLDYTIEKTNSESFNVVNTKTNKKNKNSIKNNTSTYNKNKKSENKGGKIKSKKNTKRDGEVNLKPKSSEKAHRESKSVSDRRNVEKRDKRRKKQAQEKSSPIKNDKSTEHTKIGKSNNNKKSKTTENESKNSNLTNKLNTNKNKLKNDIQEEVKQKKSNKNTADIEVCFDINEDCANLEHRRTRNNKNDYRINNQQRYAKQFPDNFASYMNNAMYNQQLNPNFYNSIANYPFNFDYIYKMLQQSNMKPNVTSKKRKNKRKKQKSKKDNKRRNENKNQDTQKAGSSDCEKVIELTPQYMEIEQTTAKEITSFNEEVTDKTEETKNDIVTPKSLEDTNEHIVPHISDSSKEAASNNSPADQEDYNQFLNENYITDDYYPDFTSDNIYLSKEEFESNSFRNRYYYASDNEITRDKPNENELRKTDNSKDINFRIPPALEFPDFKTEMIDKDRYIEREKFTYKDYENNNSKKQPKNVKSCSDNGEFNLDFNNVETVYANSKVIKYGVPPKEETAIDSPEVKKRVGKNLLSTDGETTVVLARSLGYNDY